MVKEKTKCDDVDGSGFVKDQTKQSRGYKASLVECYNACKNHFGNGMFVYHNVNYADADCKSNGCFCACYDTRKVNCKHKSIGRMDLYKIN